MIQFECEHCRRPVRVADAHGGKKGRCPHCREVVMIPARSEEIAALAAALGSEPDDDSSLGTVPPPPAVGAADLEEDFLLPESDDALADTVLLPAEVVVQPEESLLDHYHLRPALRPPTAHTKRTVLIVAITVAVLAAAVLGFVLLSRMYH